MEEKKKFIITISAVSTGVLVLLGVMLYQFSVLGVSFMKGPNSLTTKVDKVEKNIVRIEGRLEVELPAKKQEREDIRRNEGMAKQLLPTSIAPEKLLRFIHAKAELALIDLVAIKAVVTKKANTNPFAMGAKKENWEEIVYKTKLLGTYDQLALFINYLEMFEIPGKDGKPVKRLFAVKDLKIKAEDDGIIEGGRHDITLDISTYTFEKPAAAPAF
jgi:hypothetical protein